MSVGFGSCMSKTSDSLGHDLLRSRTDWVERSVKDGFSKISFENEKIYTKESFVICGVGSSEAQARFLVSLINRYTNSKARFAPYSSFLNDAMLEKGDNVMSNSNLVLFSQGISNNAQIVLAKRHLFKSVVLFTSVTGTGLAEIGDVVRLSLYEKLLQEMTSIVRFPLESEHTILIRVIGPIFGFFAAARWCHDSLGQSFNLASNEALSSMVHKVQASNTFDWPRLAREFEEGVELTFTNETHEYGQNLAYKWVEGIFGDQPILRDGFQYAHGPFQKNWKKTRTQWIFSSESNSERILVDSILSLISKTGSTVRVIESPVAEPWAFVYYELVLNRIMSEAISNLGVNQIDWPGKGEDAEVYLLNTPF